MVGAEEARPSAPLLADFDFQVPPSPVPPGETPESRRRSAPSSSSRWAIKGNRQFRFYAALARRVDRCRQRRNGSLVDGTNDEPIVVSRSEGDGTVRRDRRHALRQQREPRHGPKTVPRNSASGAGCSAAWWLGQEEWNPPPAARPVPRRTAQAEEEPMRTTRKNE